MGGLDLSAVARGMKPTGLLSLREDARARFDAGAIMVIDYGRPLVRERSVWGGVLVPFDSVWRYGANDATHLFTTRPLTFGTVSLTPGMYTLWVQHTRQGTFLILNRQTGQWGRGTTSARMCGASRCSRRPRRAFGGVDESGTGLGPQPRRAGAVVGRSGDVGTVWGRGGTIATARSGRREPPRAVRSPCI